LLEITSQLCGQDVTFWLEIILWTSIDFLRPKKMIPSKEK
jgi:hypothetical protein